MPSGTDDDMTPWSEASPDQVAIPTPLRALILEDRPADAELMVHELRRAGFNPDWARVETEQEYLSHLDPALDIILADYHQPQFDALRALHLLQESGLDIPIIVITGILGDELAVELIKRGAADFLLKDRLGRLGQAVGKALEQKMLREERNGAEEERARLLAETEQNLQYTRTLYEIGLATTSTLDLQAVLNVLLEKIDLLLPYSTATTIRLIDKENGDLEPAACWQLGEEEWRSAVKQGQEGLSETAIKNKSALIIGNVQTDSRTRYPEFFREQGLVSYLGVPLIAKGEVLGVLSFFTKEQHEFSDEEVKFLSMLAGQLALSIHNSQLYEQTKKQALQLEQDISERKRADDQLKQAHTELKKSHEELKAMQLQLIQAEKLESVGRLAAGVAHEVKNPLEIILLSVEYLSKNLTSCDEETATILDDIDYSVRRADSVIKGLLDFSASDEISTSIEELNPIIEGSLLLVKHELDRSHVAPVRELSENLPQVSLDRNKIKQVFVNLFINAIHAMPGGGTLTVRTYAKQLTETDHKAGHIRAGHFSIGETVVIAEVEDTGTGIPEGQLTKIFDPFFTTKPTGKGTGLGLTVTSKIIDLHGGMIDIRNRNEGGVRVSVLFKAQGRHQ